MTRPTAHFSGAKPSAPSLDCPVVESCELRAWRAATVRPVSSETKAHSIHSYFNTSPESPDGHHVVWFHSTTNEGEHGELRLLNRRNGSVRTLKTGLTTEDAHRVACQQWADGGRSVAYHDFRDGRWLVAAIDIETGEERILAEDRQLGFGSALSPWVPIYGAHWKQGAHRGLELVHVSTGEIRSALTIDTLLASHQADVRHLVGEGDVSVFFPVLSPDATRVFFKLARGAGGDDFRSPKASVREGKFVFDLSTGKIIRVYDRWGHPAWMPDARGIVEKGNVIFFPDTGDSKPVAPDAPSDHPTVSPDGRLLLTDANISQCPTGMPDEWAVIVASMDTGEHSVVHRFIHKDGARSWRVPHPHPVFSADNQRIYFNISSGGLTRLHVAEVHPS